jgi:hypothetical protein
MMKSMMKIIMNVVEFGLKAAVLAVIVWVSYQWGYYIGGYHMPPQPTLTEAKPDVGEADRIGNDLLQIRGIIEKYPDGFWASNYAGWLHSMEWDAQERERAKAEHANGL